MSEGLLRLCGQYVDMMKFFSSFYRLNQFLCTVIWTKSFLVHHPRHEPNQLTKYGQNWPSSSWKRCCPQNLVHDALCALRALQWVELPIPTPGANHQKLYRLQRELLCYNSYEHFLCCLSRMGVKVKILKSGFCHWSFCTCLEVFFIIMIKFIWRSLFWCQSSFEAHTKKTTNKQKITTKFCLGPFLLQKFWNFFTLVFVGGLVGQNSWNVSFRFGGWESIMLVYQSTGATRTSDRMFKSSRGPGAYFLCATCDLSCESGRCVCRCGLCHWFTCWISCRAWEELRRSGELFFTRARSRCLASGSCRCWPGASVLLSSASSAPKSLDYILAIRSRHCCAAWTNSRCRDYSELLWVVVLTSFGRTTAVMVLGWKWNDRRQKHVLQFSSWILLQSAHVHCAEALHYPSHHGLGTLFVGVSASETFGVEQKHVSF